MEVERDSYPELPKTKKVLSLRPEIENYLRSVISLSYGQNSYTLHDWRHSEKVEELCSKLVPAWVLRKLSLNELFILIIGLWLHDGGMVPEYQGQPDEEIRENHHRIIARRIRNKELDFLTNEDPRILGHIATLCESHCESNIDNVSRVRKLGTEDINLQLLCGILRLCDICHITSDRTPLIIYKHFVFGKESKKQWDKHMQIHGFDAVHNENETHFIIDGTYKSERELEYLHDTVKFIEAELERLKPTFNEYGWNISCKIEQHLEESIPQDEKITVLPQNIYALLFEHIYESKSVYIRELIQNAIDSCKIKRKWCESKDINYEPVIQVTLYNQNNKGQKSPYILKIFDNGMGMHQADVKDFLLEIGTGISKSQQINELLNSGKSPENLIAEFGIGFLTCFPVSSHIIIKTQKEGFYGLRLEFPDFSRDYGAISEKYVRIVKENIANPGTIIILYLNEQDRTISVPEALNKHCRNLNFKVCYQEADYKDEKELWDFHEHNSSCKIIRKQFLGEDEEEKYQIRFGFDGKSDFEGLIAYSPRKTKNNFYISQEGIYVEDCPDLIPDIFIGIKGEINVKAKMLDLTAPRNRIKRNEKFNNLKDKLDGHFDQLRRKILSANPIDLSSYGYGEVDNEFIALLNRSYKACKNNSESLKAFYESIERNIKIFFGEQREQCSLYDIRKKLGAKTEIHVYQLIEHKYWFSFWDAGSIDGYDIQLHPKFQRFKAKALTSKGHVVIITIHGHLTACIPEGQLEKKFLDRDFYSMYFKVFGYEVHRSEPEDVTGIISDSIDDSENTKIVRLLLKDNSQQCFSNNNVEMRCAYNSGSCINVSHPNVKRILEKYGILKEKNMVSPQEEALVISYLQLISFEFAKSIECLETLLLDTFDSKEKKTKLSK